MRTELWEPSCAVHSNLRWSQWSLSCCFCIQSPFFFFWCAPNTGSLTTASPGQGCLDATVQGGNRQVWAVLRVEEDLHQAVGSALTQLMALLHKLQLQHLAASPCVSEQDSADVLQWLQNASVQIPRRNALCVTLSPCKAKSTWMGWSLYSSAPLS